MEEKGFFATTFRGFCKEDVLNYIDSLNATHGEEITVLREQLTALQAEKELLTAQLTPLQEEVQSLRDEQTRRESAERELQAARQQIAALEETARQSESVLQTAQEDRAKLQGLQTEIAIQKQQLDGQQQQLAQYENLFGDCKNMSAYVQNKVSVPMQQANRRAQTALDAVEHLTAEITDLLAKVRQEAADLREQNAAAAQTDHEQLQDWLAQFQTDITAPADTSFFRTAADSEI